MLADILCLTYVHCTLLSTDLTTPVNITLKALVMLNLDSGTVITKELIVPITEKISSQVVHALG